MREILRFRNYRHFKGGIYSVMGISLPIAEGTLIESFKRSIDDGHKPLIAKHTEIKDLNIEHYGNCLHADSMCHDASKCKDILVVYVSLLDGVVYCREYDMFAEKLDKELYPGYDAEYRFELITDIKKNDARSNIFYEDEYTSVLLGDSKVVLGTDILLTSYCKGTKHLPMVTFNETSKFENCKVGEPIDISDVKFINEKYNDVVLIFKNKESINALRATLNNCEEIFNEYSIKECEKVESKCE